MSVVIETTIGDITVDLYLKERPNTCLNFLKLCKVKYYNLCLFHKIETNFIAQTGDPTGTGRGGESIFCQLYGDQAKYFDSEFKPRLKHEKLGTLSMVNNGNNMNGSQFFITLGENLTYLDEVHTVFGEVAEGFEILLKLNDAICDENNRPYQDIRITHTVVLHDPYDDPKGLEIPNFSPEPTREQLETDYIGADEEIDDTKGKSAEEIEEKIKESEAKARATILEMVGDIPDVDVKPPENVLFVCKLNPVTTSEDLEVIFSRFGPIVSCEVIKDHKTGESLQYAFIEFEKEEDCENAYFKMDNVLIDDRRIHVDFSQSVAKMNFDKSKMLTKNKSKSQNIVIKNNTKGTVGYDLIFDTNDNSEHASSKIYKNRDRSHSPHKYKNNERKSRNDNKPDSDKKVKNLKNPKACSRSPEQNYLYSDNRQPKYKSRDDYPCSSKSKESRYVDYNTDRRKFRHELSDYRYSHSNEKKNSENKKREKYSSLDSFKYEHKSKHKYSDHSQKERYSSSSPDSSKYKGENKLSNIKKRESKHSDHNRKKRYSSSSPDCPKYQEENKYNSYKSKESDKEREKIRYKTSDYEYLHPNEKKCSESRSKKRQSPSNSFEYKYKSVHKYSDHNRKKAYSFPNISKYEEENKISKIGKKKNEHKYSDHKRKKEYSSSSSNSSENEEGNKHSNIKKRKGELKFSDHNKKKEYSSSDSSEYEEENKHSNNKKKKSEPKYSDHKKKKGYSSSSSDSSENEEENKHFNIKKRESERKYSDYNKKKEYSSSDSSNYEEENKHSNIKKRDRNSSHKSKETKR